MSEKIDLEFNVTTNIADISQLTLKKDSVLIVECQHLMNIEQRKNLIRLLRDMIDGADNKIFIMPHGTKLKTLTGE